MALEREEIIARINEIKLDYGPDFAPKSWRWGAFFHGKQLTEVNPEELEPRALVEYFELVITRSNKQS